MRLGGPGIGQPDGPWLRALRNERLMHLRSRRADKDQLLAIWRPAWRKVAINAGRNVTHALLSQIKDRDEGMIFSASPECEMSSVRRPLRLALIAAQLRELARRFVGSNVGDPQMVLWPHPNRSQPVRRKLNVLTVFFSATHLAQQSRLASFHIGSPHLLFGLFRLRRGIRNVAFTAHLRPARIDHGLAVRRELYGKNILAVVTFIMRHLSPSEIRRVGHPYVAFAPAVKHPGNAVRFCRRGQRRGERRTHHLFQSKAGLSRVGILRDGGSCKDKYEQ